MLIPGLELLETRNPLLQYTVSRHYGLVRCFARNPKSCSGADVVGRPLSVCPLRTLFADRRLTLLLEAFDGAHCEYPRAYLSLLPSNPLW